MQDKILIIGGYGVVGGHIAEYLSHLYPQQIIVSGRSYAKAEKFAKKLSNRVIAFELDIDTFEDDVFLDEVRMVIVCLDTAHIRLAEVCVSRSIIYLDISAQYETLARIETLNTTAIVNKSTAVLSVGLAPGLTNLLAQYCYSQLSSTQYIDIFVLLGLGEKHGKQAYRWTFNHMDHNYQVGSAVIKSFTSPIHTELHSMRSFYTFDFSDQHVLTSTLSPVEVRTRLSFDVKWFTKATFILKKIGLTKLLKKQKIQDVIIKNLHSWSLGTSIFGVKVVAKNVSNTSVSYSFIGYDESKVTAIFASELVQYILQNPNLPHGVLHSQQLIKDIPAFIAKIQQHDPRFQFKSSSNS